MKLFVFFITILISQTSIAATETQAIDFIIKLIPTGKDLLTLDSKGIVPCQLEIYHRQRLEKPFKSGGAAYVTLWIQKDGEPWPVKFDVEENATYSELQFATINGNYLKAQNVVIPNEEYGSKERQTMTLTYTESKIEVYIVNEQKGWFSYKQTDKAQCSFDRL